MKKTIRETVRDTVWNSVKVFVDNFSKEKLK